MRAGDGDRQAVAERLKAALDEGRLDLHEYDERLQKTYAAKTFGDLKGLLDDLPGTVPPQQARVAPHHAAAPQPVQQDSRSSGPAWVFPFGGVFVVCVLIWAITSISSGHLQYFWPVWLLIPLIFGIVGQLASRASRSAGPDRRARRDRRYR
jgi:Domain of unknown function (DUF1707)